MAILTVTQTEIIGAHGRLPLKAGDHAARKLALLIMTICLGDSVADAVAACGYTRARYYQVRRDYLRGGTDALRRRKPGRTHNTVLTPAVEREVVRHLVLDADATPRVVTRRMRQQGTPISQRSVERTVTNFGLQKKAQCVSAPERGAHRCRPRKQKTITTRSFSPQRNGHTVRRPPTPAGTAQ